MRIWKFEIERQINNKWDYIIPWGVALFEAVALTIVFAYGYSEEIDLDGNPTMETVIPSTNDWLFYSTEIALLFLLMALSTFYLKREFRFAVSPLAFLGSSLIPNRIVNPSLLVGLGYALGSLIVCTTKTNVKIAWKNISIYWGVVGAGYGLINLHPMLIIKALGLWSSTIQSVSLISLLPLVFPIITAILSHNLTSSSTGIVLLNALIWAIIFALIGLVISIIVKK